MLKHDLLQDIKKKKKRNEVEGGCKVERYNNISSPP
jgi:hypothetical protein